MTTIRIDAATLSQSGKSYQIKSGSDTYYAKTDQGVNNADGKTIEAEEADSEYKGKVMKWINAYKLVQTAGSPSSGGGANPPVASDIMRFMPFVSNTVNGALRAGMLTEPSQVSAWAKAAYEAALALESIAEFRQEL